MAKKKKKGTGKTRKVTDYNKAFGAARKACADPTAANEAKFKKAAKKYIESAVKKGNKTKKQATATMKKISRCDLSK